MSRPGAQTAVVLSMFWVALVFGYRKVTEGTVSSAPATAHFVIGFGFASIVLSLMAQAAPSLGGMMAILVATGDTLANGKQIFSDVSGALQSTGGTAAAAQTAAANPAAGSANAGLVHGAGTITQGQ